MQHCLEGAYSGKWRVVVEEDIVHCHCEWLLGVATFDSHVAATQRLFESVPNP